MRKLHGILLLGLCLALLAACGGSPAPGGGQSDSAKTTVPTGGVRTPRPTTAPGEKQPGAEQAEIPTAEAGLPVDAGVVLYSNPGVGSVEGILLSDGQALMLADPNMAHPAALPWSLSPDGKTIAVVTGIHMDGSIKNGRLSAASLWLVDVDASNPRKLLDLVGETMPLDSMQLMGLMSALVRRDYQLLPWTSNGAAVVVTSAHEGQADLYLVPVDGSAPRRLTETPDMEIQPTLSHADQLVFASVDNFGTGAGWGGVKAAMMPLAGGEPRPAIGDLPPELRPSSVQVLGWVRDAAVVQTSDMGSSNTTLWATGDGAPEILFRTPAQVLATINADALTFATNTRFVEHQPEADGLYQWLAGDEQPRKLLDQGGVNSVHTPPAPMGGMALLCLGDDGMSYAAAYWNGSELVELGEGTCGESMAWSERGGVAYGSGLIDGTATQALPRHAIPAGWTDAGLYFFAPTDDTLSLWQLYLQRDGARQPIGEPIGQKPERPTLVRG